MNHSNVSEGEAKQPKRTAREQILSSLTLVGWLAVCTATYLAAEYMARTHPEWSPGWKVTIALTPILPGLLYLRKGLQLLRGKDELQRRIQLEAWLFAALGTVVFNAVLNVLKANGVAGNWLPHGLQVGGTYLTMYFFWSIGQMISNLRYL